MKDAVALVLAALLCLEAANSVLWLAGIAQAPGVYGGPVLALAAVRAFVTALQFTSAALLARRALPAVFLARVAFGASAALLIVELGFGLAPTSVPPWLGWRVVAGYVIYAILALVALGWISRTDGAAGE